MRKDLLAPTDSRVVIVCLLISLVISGVIWLETRRLERSLLIEQESQEAMHWATVLGSRLSEHENFLTYGKISDEDQDLFTFAATVGRISDYKVYNEDGRIVVSTRADDLGQVSTNPYFDEHVKAGRPFSIVREYRDAESQQAFESLALVPVLEGGVFRGAIEVRTDVTARATIIVDNLRNARYGLLGIVALLGLSFAALIRRYLQSRNEDLGLISASVQTR